MLAPIKTTFLAPLERTASEAPTTSFPAARIVVGAGRTLTARRAADAAPVVGQAEVPPLGERPCEPEPVTLAVSFPPHVRHDDTNLSVPEDPSDELNAVGNLELHAIAIPGGCVLRAAVRPATGRKEGDADQKNERDLYAEAITARPERKSKCGRARSEATRIVSASPHRS